MSLRTLSEKNFTQTIVGLILVIVSLAMMLLCGFLIAKGSMLPFLLAVGVMVLSILLPNPIRGLYLAYPTFFLVPFGVMSVSAIPLFNSPLDIIVSATFIIGLLNFVLRKKKLPKSKIYTPLLVCAMVLIFYAIIGHGDASFTRAMRFVQGLWPLVLVVLLLETPRQAKNILIDAIGTLVILSILWMPGLITAGKYGENLIRRGVTSVEGSSSISRLSMSYASSVSSYVTLIAMALVSLVLFCLIMAKLERRKALLVWVSFIFLAAAIMWVGYTAAMATLIMGVFLAILIGLGNKVLSLNSAIIRIAVAIVLASILLMILPQGMYTFERLQEPSEDTGASVRIWDINQGVQAFVDNPLIGYGAYDTPRTSSSGQTFGIHSTFVGAAYQFGLLFIIPFIWLLLSIGMGYLKLARRASRPLEKTLAIGFLTSYLAAIFAGFLDPVFMEPGTDAYIWLFAGIMIVWNHWLDLDPKANLID